MAAVATPQNAPSELTIEEVRASQRRLQARINEARFSKSTNNTSTTADSIPLIDIGPSFDGSLHSRQAIAAQIHSACTEIGFFQITNHGVAASARDQILEQARRFFHELDPAKKNALHIRHSNFFRGWEPSGYTNVNPDDWEGDDDDAEVEEGKETKEGFNWGYEDALDPAGGDGCYVELDGTKPPHGSANVWPAEEDLPGFYAAVREYYGQVSFTHVENERSMVSRSSNVDILFPIYRSSR